MKSKSVQFDNTHKSGFTLIELLVVITIMTIMTGIGAGIFTGANQKLQVQKAASGLLIMAQYARMSAVEEQRAYKLYLDTTNNEFYLATTDFDDSGASQEVVIDNSFCAPITLNSPINIEDVRVLSNDYNLGNTSKNMYMIAFAPDGTSQTSLAQIGDGKVHYTLSVNEITGKSKLYPTVADNVKVDTIDLDAE
jgi:prepilin-type N-terminal cleavage/methylation domain-containing protein